MSGDEIILPHKGKRSGPLRQFVPRKPHSTGLKLHVLADACRLYVTGVYLYCSNDGVVRDPHREVIQCLTPSEVVGGWTTKLSEGTTPCAESYFESHASARQSSRCRTPFLFLCKGDDFGVQKMAENLRPGQVATGVRTRGHFAQHVYKNPKVGRKPPRVVRVLTTCNFEPKWRGSGTKESPTCIGAYRQLAGGVDTAHQLALQYREVGRFHNCAKALQAFVLRYAMSNAFVACKSAGIIPESESMWDYQLNFMHELFRPNKVPKQHLHWPVASGGGPAHMCKMRKANHHKVPGM